MEAVIRKQTSFRLREDLLQILQEQAKKANRSLNNFVESTLMDAVYSEPNEETIAAIREARTTKNKETFDSVDSLMEELMKWKRNYTQQASLRKISNVFRNSPKKIAAFEYIANLLINDHPIPQEYKPHMLKGEYKGCMECHIEGDFLLIWIDGEIIDLLRIGSHSELFGKKR